MAMVTYDPLDAPLGEAFQYYQRMPDSDRGHFYKRNVIVDPRNWLDYQPPTWAWQLNWNEYKYSEIQERRDLDDEITSTKCGFYIFYIRPQQLFLNRFPQLALYIGIASGQPLVERLKDYLPRTISAIRKRDNIHKMLRLYYDAVWVSYATTDAHEKDIKALEKTLHGFLCPGVAEAAHPAGIKKQMRSF